MGDQNTNTTGTAPETQQEKKTFTQEQMDSVLKKRLAEQKQSLEKEFVKREEKLNQREMQIRAKELLSERGLPKQLADVLKYSDEKSLIAAIDTIEHTRGFKSSAENEQAEQGKGAYEGFRPMGKEAFHEHDGSDPFRKAWGLN